LQRLLIGACIAIIAGTAPALAAPPGAAINNQATLEFRNVAGQSESVASNVVELTAAVVRSAATLQFTRIGATGVASWQEPVGPSACRENGTWVPQGNPVLVGGTVIDPAAAQPVVPAAAYNLGEPVFLRLLDADQNLDFQAIDYAEVVLRHPESVDSESLRLAETGPDTGVFAGYLVTAGGTATSGDCILQGAPQTLLEAQYTDPADSADMGFSSAEFDPVQRVFDSFDGRPVSGATIELVDAVSGMPATVYGNDGVSQFPSSVTSGATVTDSSGATYAFGPGEYRFPVVPDGDYRLVVVPPAEYAAPSAADASDLQSLPGAPFDLGPASFGGGFSKSGGLSFAWDIPLDPLAESLFLEKRTLTTTAAPGDFVRYELVLENSSRAGLATDVVVRDQLPEGVRFRFDSVTVDGEPAPDPRFAPEPDTLVFRFPSLDAGERITIAYVVEIVGGAPGEELVNRAIAQAAGGLVSNEATALIRLTEDLFRSTGTIVGRIVEGDCSQDGFAEEQGVANVRVYLEDGSYAVTDEGGRYHFDGVEPGTHVAQLDLHSIPAWFDVIGCTDTPGFAGRADSQFVKLSRGSLLRADFYLRRKPAPEGRIDLELSSSGTDGTDRVRYALEVEGIGNVPVSNIDAMVMLPKGIAYVPGSMRIDGEDLGDPHISGDVLSMALPDRNGNWHSTATFEATIADKTSGELTTRATARFDSPIEQGQTTPVAETRMLREMAKFENAGYVLDLKFAVLSDQLSAEDKQKLDRLVDDWRGVRDIRLSVVGHSDSQPISARNQHLFPDNYALSQARATSAAGYVATALGLGSAAMQVTGRGPDEPVADNATSDGRARNRRVEMVLSGVRPSRPSFLEVTKASSGTQVAPTQGAVPGTETTGPADSGDEEAVVQKEPPIESLAAGIEMLLPAEGDAPAVPATKLSVKHAPGQTVEVWVNGEPVNAANFDGVEVNKAGTVAVSRWAGVELREGENELRAVVQHADGKDAETLHRTIVFSGVPIRGEIVADLSTLIADGKTRPVVAVRLYDRAGDTARRGMVGHFRVEDPYRSWWDVENDRLNPLVQTTTREPGYRVGKDGIARIELEPTTRTGEVKLILKFENHREQELKAWLEPAAREWILVGFAEGTAGYNTLSENMVAAAEAGIEEDYYDEGRVAFFAKGQVRGEYLLTLAYDSDREYENTQDEFGTVIDPNRYYPLYADTSERRFEAPSQRKIYVKLERNQFYALFGDFETGLTVTDLTRYQRRFNGLLSEFRGENIGYSAFAAESSQAFNRDELQGDGTSGLYYLSNAPIVVNSEEIRIEVRDRFDSGIVLESRTLTRFLDYSLDPLDGSLYFRQPVPSRDLEFNPIYIVAEYESLTAGGEDVVAGGRASLRTSDDNLEVGVTHVNDDSGDAGGELSGVDLRWQINHQTLLTAEVAESSSMSGSTAEDGSAASVELEHNGEGLDLRAFIREVDDGFGLGYQSEADKGVRRLGVDARAELGEHWAFDGEAGWQQLLATRDIRNLARAQLRYDRNSFGASLGLTHAEDEFADGDARQSELVDVGLSKRFLDDRLTLRINNSTALNDEAESLDFPTRLLLGADYRLNPNVDLVAEYEEAEGRDIRSTMSRLGVRATPWARAQIDTSLGNEVTEYGPRLFANIGLIQGFQLSERWLLDVGFDQTDTLTNDDERQFDPDRELVSGSFRDDYLAIHTGATYTADLWTANSRIEYRNSDTEKRTALLAGWYREPMRGHGLSAGLTMYQARPEIGGELAHANLRFGWAWRPAYARWTFLDRLDLGYDNFDNRTSREKSYRIVNNFNANRRIGASTQLALQYASKFVRTQFSNAAYYGYTDLAGVDFRRGFAARWDAGVNMSLYHAWESDVFDLGLGMDVGYNLGTNIWLSLGYNVIGFHDDDFAAARYTAQGPFLRFSIKADQHTLKEIAGQQ
jgi:uncharacterized repeat protein (TIGR01451 family)